MIQNNVAILTPKPSSVRAIPGSYLCVCVCQGRAGGGGFAGQTKWPLSMSKFESQ